MAIEALGAGLRVTQVSCICWVAEQALSPGCTHPTQRFVLTTEVRPTWIDPVLRPRLCSTYLHSGTVRGGLLDRRRALRLRRGRRQRRDPRHGLAADGRLGLRLGEHLPQAGAHCRPTERERVSQRAATNWVSQRAPTNGTSSRQTTAIGAKFIHIFTPYLCSTFTGQRLIRKAYSTTRDSCWRDLEMIIDLACNGLALQYILLTDCTTDQKRSVYQ